ncbi:MAG TPA: hypothetical protein VEK57_22865 [Thermoanaerobaculia bacterium]|nr:hypothetical protein [Thermoanaerobaculia bacterium]
MSTSEMSTPELPPRHPRPTRVVASSATLEDSFPRTTAFDIGREHRPFAVVGRRGLDGQPRDPDLIVVSAHGMLHRFTPKDSERAQWDEEKFELAELRGGVVLRVTAVAYDPVAGDERLIVTISGQKADGERVFIMLQRTAAGWRRVNPAGSVIAPRILSQAVSSGFTAMAGGKLQIYYACLPGDSSYGSLFGFGFDNAGGSYICAFRDRLQGPDRLVTPAGPDRAVSLARVTNNFLSIYPATGPLNPSHGVLNLQFDLERRSHSYRIATTPGAIDGSYLTPINDTLGHCHGMFVRTKSNALYAVMFANGGREMICLTGIENGPDVIEDVTYSFYGAGNLHIFASDGNGLVWYADCPAGTSFDQLVWKPTGQQSYELEAPQISGVRPFVIAEGQEDRLDRLTSAGANEQWSREGVTVAEPQLEAVPATVHTITLAAVTADDIPVEGTRLVVRAERPLVAEYEGRLFQLMPDRPATFVTKGSGGVGLRVRSTGVDTPALLVTSPDMTGLPEQKLRPQAASLRRMAGLDAGFPVTGQSLKGAGLIPASMPADEADKVAGTFRQAALESLGLKPTQLAGEDAWFPAGVTIVRDGDSFRVRDAGLVLGADSVEVTVASSAASFWSWLKGAWNTVKEFTINIVNKGVELIVKAAGAVVQFVTDAARYIASGLQAVVSWLGKLGSDLIDAGRKVASWVAEKLGWSDVLRCKEAVKRYALSGLMELETLFGSTFPRTVSDMIQFAQQKVDSLFDDAVTRFGGGSMGPSDARNSPMRKQLQENGAKAMLIHHAVPNAPTTKELIPLSPELRQKMEKLYETSQSMRDGDRFRALLKSLGDIFNNKMSLEQGFSILLGELLAALRPLAKLAFETADVVQTLVFELIALAIRTFRLALEAPVTDLGAAFGWVDRLYQQFSGGASLSVIDLASLLFVAPGVILYHVVTGKSVIPEGTPVPETMPTAFTAIATVFAGASGVAATGPIITNAMKVAFDYIAKPMEVAVAAYSVLRATIVQVENGLRVSDLEGVNTDGVLRSAFQGIVFIADWLPVVHMVAEFVVRELGAVIENAYRENPQLVIIAALAILGMVALELTLKVIAQIRASWNRLAAGLKVVIMAVISLLSGVALLLFNIAYMIIWSVWGPGKNATEREKKLFFIARGASIWLQGRKFAQLGIPIGLQLIKAGEPVGKGIGVVMFGGNAAADFLGFLGYGVTMGYRAAL